MSKINVLSFEIANLIAAGEVVERPSSVLKELIENSIDSGASSIVAEIKRGGVALIRVTDNGCGIEKEDLPIALKRHATSKIREKEDLDSIMTLGFRGEALAAISSVSEMTIISKTRDAEVATMLTASAGRVVDITEVGASDGTTVVVENLFGNVPARRKFLKKDATEAMNVTALVEKVAVSHPEISIQLLIDGEQRFKTPGDGELYNAIYAVFGKEFASKLIKAEGIANGVKVSGYIGRSDNVKKNRNLQNFFINGRYVKSMTAMAAIEKAYTSYIAPECFPTCILFLEMNPGAVDVNVHPAKLEVKFTDERAVFEAVYYTVKTALEDHEYRPEMNLSQSKRTDYNPLGAFVPLGSNTKGEQIKMSVSNAAAHTPVQSTTAEAKSIAEAKPRSEVFSKQDIPI
ncbi:MAG: DNA mismatch repair endonuclease MutL, partial [Clostridia bacterium]|nr:DNA mismatch repair endonuclease MutL [Clostridia bacterium]